MLGISKVNRTLIFSDFFLQAGLGLFAPLFAIFITKDIGGTVAAVGFVTAAYWLTKSVIQPFVARALDNKKGEKDDFLLLIIGMYVANVIPLGYVFVTNVAQLIILEAIRGLAMACVIPTWGALFTRHMDKGFEAFSWSIESTAIGLAAGLSAALGGILVTILGFEWVFVLVSVFGLLASTVLLSLKKHMFSAEHFDEKQGNSKNLL
jgi:predicted MFS family arabinose efflux permease